MNCFQHIFGQQISQNTQTDLCVETKSTTDCMIAVNSDSTESECSDLIEKPVCHKRTEQFCAKKNQVHLSGVDKQVIEIRLHVNTTVQTESEQRRNKSIVSENQGNVPDVTIEITSPLKCGYDKDNRTSAVYTEDIEARKCKFLTNLGLVPVTELEMLQQNRVTRPSGYSDTLLSRVAGLSRSRRRKCNVRKIVRFHQRESSKYQIKKKTRSYKGRNVHLQSSLQRVPIVKLTRMDDCKKLKEKYFSQISEIQNIRCCKKIVKN